jgi:hypothetical protein
MMKPFSSLTFVVSLMCLWPGCEAHCEDNSVRQIPISQVEHGYGNFENTVLSTRKEFDEFLKTSNKSGWNKREKFDNTLKDMTIDFTKELLVLVRHTEGSGSIRVTLDSSVLKDNRLLVAIKRGTPTIGTMDMAYHCFAFVVPITVKAIVVDVNGKNAKEFLVHAEK